MIQPQDLRINDYVLYEGRIVRIDSITKVFSPIGYECAVYLEHKGLMRVPINALQPIPLTEELLLKCGFEFIPEENGYYCFYRYVIEDKYKHSFKFDIRNNDECEIANNGVYVYYNWDINIGFKYLHEIQNFIEPLTGFELEIKL